MRHCHQKSPCYSPFLDEWVLAIFFDDQNESITPYNADGTARGNGFFTAGRPQLSIDLHAALVVDFCPGFPDLTDQPCQIVSRAYARCFGGFPDGKPQKNGYRSGS